MAAMGLLDRVDLKRSTVAPPEAIDLTPDGRLHVQWGGGEEAKPTFKQVRDACPCAVCIEEWTGRKLLDPATIPDDIRPLAIEAVGHYGVKITWSDGHDSGIYDWKTLRRACGLGV